MYETNAPFSLALENGTGWLPWLLYRLKTEYGLIELCSIRNIGWIDFFLYWRKSIVCLQKLIMCWSHEMYSLIRTCNQTHIWLAKKCAKNPILTAASPLNEQCYHQATDNTQFTWLMRNQLTKSLCRTRLAQSSGEIEANKGRPKNRKPIRSTLSSIRMRTRHHSKWSHYDDDILRWMLYSWIQS